MQNMQNMQKKFPSENDLATNITHSQKIPKIESQFWLMSAIFTILRVSRVQ